MTDSRDKRKYAGVPISEKRKIVPEPPKNPHTPKPRVWVLKEIERCVSEREIVTRYGTKSARDQAKADRLKKMEALKQARRRYPPSWYRKNQTTLTFEESEE